MVPITAILLWNHYSETLRGWGVHSILWFLNHWLQYFKTPLQILLTPSLSWGRRILAYSISSTFNCFSLLELLVIRFFGVSFTSLLGEMEGLTETELQACGFVMEQNFMWPQLLMEMWTMDSKHQLSAFIHGTV